MRWWCALAVAAALAGAPAAAFALDEEPRASRADVELGRVHFQRGVELYRSGAYDAALAEFTRANEAAPSFRILYNLAQIQAQRHDYVAAHALFARYLHQGAQRVPEARATEVLLEMRELERRISRLRVDTNVEDVRLFINDLPVLQTRDEPLALNAGIYRLRADKDGYVSASQTVTLTGGDDTSVTLELGAELDMDDPARPAPPPTPVLPPPPPVDRSAFWASLAATGALTGATLTFGLLTRRANDTLEAQLGRLPAPRESIDESRSRVRSYALLTDICGVAALGALGLTTYLYLSLDEPSEGRVERGLRPELGLRSASLTWSGDF